LTSNETAVVLFLATAAIGGALLRSVNGPAQGANTLAYRLHDSTFAARAAAIDPDPVPEAGAPQLPSPSQGKGKAAPGGKVDLNKASAQELQSLPGVGPSTAARIISYRMTIGPFERMEDLMDVPSIGKKKFEKIKPYLSVLK
jgi:comEA protein